MNLRIILLLVILSVFFSHCLNPKTLEKTSIIPLSPYSFVDTIEDSRGKQIIRVEFYLVINAPADTSKLKIHIDQFNKSTLGGVEKKFTSLQRTFYKESNKLTRNYIDTREDPLEDYYIKNKIADVFWSDGGRRSYTLFFKNGEAITDTKSIITWE